MSVTARRPLDDEDVFQSFSDLEVPEPFIPLLWKTMPHNVAEYDLSHATHIPAPGTPLRYKCYLGGRGSAKSYSLARALVAEAYSERHLVLCTRQFQNSIADSVHRTVSRQIEALGLTPWFRIEKSLITCTLTGSEFIFKGIQRNIQEIKSLEGVTRCWVEEGQSMTGESWIVLDPTIREPGSQIWVSYNPIDEVDPTHQMFRMHPPPDAYVAHVGWRDNPYFPIELERLRMRMLEVDPGAYDWVWEGFCRQISEAAIFRGHYVIEAFEPPDKIDRLFYGIDWGFANDPLFATRSWILDDHLYIDYEFCGIGIDIDEMDACLGGGMSPKTGVKYEGIPGIKQWPIKADNARPELISYLGRQGYNVTEAEKWNGSVEDGIAHLLGFKKIHIHERCVNLAQEARLYSYKTDPKTLDPNTGNPVVLAKVDDKHNHGWDSLRYALDGYIQYRGGIGVWRHLVRPRR